MLDAAPHELGHGLTLGDAERWYHRTGAGYDLSGAAYDELPDGAAGKAAFVRVLAPSDLGSEAASCAYRVACGPDDHAESSPSLMNRLRGSKSDDPATTAKATQGECHREAAEAEAALRASLDRGVSLPNESAADLESAHTTAQSRLREARKHSASAQAMLAGSAGAPDPPAVSSNFMESLASNLDMTDVRWSYTQMDVVGCPVGCENYEFCIQNYEFCIQNEDFCVQKRGLLYQK